MCRERLLLYTANVRTVAGIHFKEFTFINEQGNADFSTGFKRCRLERVSSGIALDTGLSVSNFQNSLDGHFCIKNSVGRSIADHFYSVTLFHECCAGNELLADGNLLESFVVHENVIATVGIEILIRTTFHSHILKLLADIEATFQNAAINHILKLGAHESVTLAGLYVKELHTEVKTAIHADTCAVFDVLSVNHIRDCFVVLFDEIFRKDNNFPSNAQKTTSKTPAHQYFSVSQQRLLSGNRFPTIYPGVYICELWVWDYEFCNFISNFAF